MTAAGIALLASLVCLHAADAQPQPTNPAAAQPQTSQPTPASPSAAAVQPTKSSPSVADSLKDRPEPWRYQWYDNRWWYYTPQNTWLYYNASGWQPYVSPATVYQPPHYRSRSTKKHVDPGHSLDTTGNYPRYWLWQRLGN